MEAKVRYSDKELENFRKIIENKIKEAKKVFKILK